MASTQNTATPEVGQWQIGEASRDLNNLLHQDTLLALPAFTSTEAWAIGHALRNRLLYAPAPTLIDITLSTGVTLFRSAVVPSHVPATARLSPDNETWVARKRTSVQRFGCSTWALHVKYAGDEAAFAQKFALGQDAGRYAIHGGGFPIRVRGVEGVVAVVVVSGLKQDQDHQVIVETLAALLGKELK